MIFPHLPSPNMNTPHNCTVHTCIVGLTTRSFNHMGQLQPMGEQWPKLNITQSEPLSSDEFYERFFKRKIPYYVKGGFQVPPYLQIRRIAFARGGDWNVIVEQQNRIIHDHREPFWTDWNFSKFLKHYKQYPYYAITSNIPSIMQTPHPRELQCDLLDSIIGESRLWMSHGNTSSSLHFDTHDVIIQQIDGTKEIFLWDPTIAPATYMDYHTRYGLSPINVDKVDLIRFPEFAKHQPHFVQLFPGDVLYLPTLWWHQFRSPPGRNIMKTIEFEYRINIKPHPTTSKTHAFLYTNHQIKTRSPYVCDRKRYMKKSALRSSPPKHENSLCETFCSEPCDVLNGDYRRECSMCDSSFACNPTVWQRHTEL